MNLFRNLLETEHGLEVYNIGTRSSTKASGEKPPEVHGADKPLDPNLKPEHQSKSKFERSRNLQLTVLYMSLNCHISM